VSDDAARDILRAVQLEHLVDRLDEDSEWAKTLARLSSSGCPRLDPSLIIHQVGICRYQPVTFICHELVSLCGDPRKYREDARIRSGPCSERLK
jgi:hypothetical protein